MAFKCFIGSHTWNGCKCSDCGKIRDIEHDWSQDCEKCSKCGSKNHRGIIKVNGKWGEGLIQHDWNKDCETCCRCGKTRENHHDWSQDCNKCSNCGKTGDNKHDYSKDCEKCSICGKIRDNHHDWSNDCEKCSKCGKTREQDWKGLKCCKCGKEQSLLNDDQIKLLKLTSTIRADSEDYVYLCFAPLESGFEHLFKGDNEEREWWRLDGLRDLPKIADKDSEKAWQIIHENEGQYNDFFFIHGWKMLLCSYSNRIEDARGFFREGLLVSKDKLALCRVMASCEDRCGEIENAIRWWIVCGCGRKQEKSNGNKELYVYLSCIANLISMEDCSKDFINYANQNELPQYVTDEGKIKYSQRLQTLQKEQGKEGIKGIQLALRKLNNLQDYFTLQTESKIDNTITESKIDNTIIKPAIEWASIPAGTFTMGSPTTEVDRWADEIQHKVTLSAFKMSKYEVTFNQYDLFCEATGRSKPGDKGWGRGNRPVINVSWDDANAFAEWMGCRLPTEAEWEYACRAGTTTPFNTGNNLTTDQANYDGENPFFNKTKGVYHAKTIPVGSFAPNAWGLYDMCGNVSEWCSDWYGDYSTVPQTDPKSPETGSESRVYRGGSWQSYARECRSACRGKSYVGYPRDNYIGFRLVSPE
jgi:formylglycine-generating enzyme